MRFQWMLGGAMCGALLLTLPGCGGDDEERLVAESNEAVARAIREAAEARLADREDDLPSTDELDEIAARARGVVRTSRDQAVVAWLAAMDRAAKAETRARELIDAGIERGSGAWERGIEEVQTAREHARQAYEAARASSDHGLDRMKDMTGQAYYRAQMAWSELGLGPPPDPLIFEDGFDGGSAERTGGRNEEPAEAQAPTVDSG